MVSTNEVSVTTKLNLQALLTTTTKQTIKVLAMGLSIVVRMAVVLVVMWDVVDDSVEVVVMDIGVNFVLQLSVMCVERQTRVRVTTVSNVGR